jgi:hypothetical protein
MSTIVTSNISDGTNTVGTEYVVNGSAKVFVNADGTGTVSINNSYNVSSMTDEGTGLYTFSFTNSFDSATGLTIDAHSSGRVSNSALALNTTPDHGTGFFTNEYRNRLGSNNDQTDVMGMAWGDLA